MTHETLQPTAIHWKTWALKETSPRRKWVPEYETSAYPNPIVDHPTARILAIETYKAALKPE